MEQKRVEKERDASSDRFFIYTNTNQHCQQQLPSKTRKPITKNILFKNMQNSRFHIFITFKSLMNSNDFGSSQNVFQKLKGNIQRLKVERDELNNQLNIDRNDINNVEGAMNQLGRQIDQRMVSVRDKQRKLMQLEKAINQTQKSYDIIVETTRKLSSALESEASHLRGLTRK